MIFPKCNGHARIESVQIQKSFRPDVICLRRRIRLVRLCVVVA